MIAHCCNLQQVWIHSTTGNYFYILLILWTLVVKYKINYALPSMKVTWFQELNSFPNFISLFHTGCQNVSVMVLKCISVLTDLYTTL